MSLRLNSRAQDVKSGNLIRRHHTTTILNRVDSGLRGFSLAAIVCLAAVGDYDNDGAVDVLISNNGGPARLLSNTATGKNHWLVVRCLDPAGKRDVIGAKVFVTAGGLTRRRDVIVNYSYASSCDPRIHFGLGEKTAADRILVQWPGGGESSWENVPANQVFIVRQPAAPVQTGPATSSAVQ